jgi:hypothetical protein
MKNLTVQLVILIILISLGTAFLVYRARKFDTIYPDPLPKDLDQHKFINNY